MQFSNRTSDESHQCWRRVYTTLFLVLLLSLGVRAESKRSTKATSGAPVFESGTGIRLVDFRVGCAPRFVSLFDSLSTWKENVTFAISIDNAQFLVFHFTYFHLPLQASLTIWDEDEYEKQDRALSRAHQQYDHTTIPSHFYTHPLHSKGAILEYVVHNSQPTDGQCYGFRIDEVRFAAQSIYRGTQSRLKPTRRQLYEVNMNAESDEYDANGKNVAMGDLLVDGEGATALGGDVNANTCVTSSDSSEEAACIRYNGGMYESSSSVVRLLVHKEMGSIFCTGWMLGCQGHIITNHHCVSNSKEANATVIEFLAQGGKCRERCDEPMGCPGIIEATSSTIVASSPVNELDYTLLLPRLSPSQRFSLIQKYGYLTLRPTGVEHNERIFIPQHPSGFGKRIAMKHKNAFGRANSVNQTGCNSLQKSVGYLLDTRGGSSGSPVIAYKDKAVIGLHYCGGCLNLAIPSEYIVKSLILVNKLPRCAQSIFPSPGPPSNMDEIDINEYEAS